MPTAGAEGSQAALLACAAAAVVGLILLIAWARVHAFIALVVAALFVGVCSGMPLGSVARAFQDGVGSTLGFIAVVIGLGTILGKLLADSGGAEVIATRLMAPFGDGRLHWAMAAVGFIVGLPVFFSVGLVLLAPILFTLARAGGVPLLFLALPLVTGLSVSHGLVPPHPGPLVAIDRLGANMGRTIAWSLAIGLPTALIVGALMGRIFRDRLRVVPGALAEQLSGVAPGPRPGFAIALGTVLLPIVLIVLATFVGLALPDGNAPRRWIEFVGTPVVAMLLAVLIAVWAFGTALGRTRDQVLRVAEESLAPVASLLLVVGAGGGFGRVLTAAGVDQAIATTASGWHLSPILLGWTVAAVLRIAVGSATVAITTASSIIAPVAAAVPGTHPELLVIALGAGSLIASHVNDGGFWLVKEYLNLSVPQTLATWTVLETVVAVVVLFLVLMADGLVR